MPETRADWWPEEATWHGMIYRPTVSPEVGPGEGQAPTFRASLMATPQPTPTPLAHIDPLPLTFNGSGSLEPTTIWLSGGDYTVAYEVVPPAGSGCAWQAFITAPGGPDLLVANSYPYGDPDSGTEATTSVDPNAYKFRIASDCPTWRATLGR